MTTYIYNSADLSVKDRLTISNLLGLFQGRLNANWVQADRARDKAVHVQLIDMDQPDGPEKWEAAAEVRVAITSDDRSSRQPFISRPIRAYGPNGVIVLFNSIAQSLSSPARESTGIRMMGRLETPPPPLRAAPPAPRPTPLPATPASTRVAVRWGPPEPISLPPLMQMPGARIHWRQAAETAPPPPPQASPRKFWSAPGAAALPPLVEMPTAHRPTEIHAPAAPLITRPNSETPAPPATDVPTLRPSPPQWKTPEPPAVDALVDFRSLSQLESEPAFGLESLSQALLDEAAEPDLSTDAGIDWWGSFDDEDNVPPADASTGSLLIHALKAIKTSAQPSILEIPGLPAVCVIPARNIYFTSAPAARLESAMSAGSDVTWRSCDSEEEARRLSGTQQSRQASLEQLSWTACLLAPPADPNGMTDRAVRLRRWPPITESRGRSKFIRYATMLSGAQATPRELSEITGDSLQEILSFVNACAQMNLLETSGQPRAHRAAPLVPTAGAGILRGMIEQLSPPKI